MDFLKTIHYIQKISKRGFKHYVIYIYLILTKKTNYLNVKQTKTYNVCVSMVLIKLNNF